MELCVVVVVARFLFGRWADCYNPWGACRVGEAAHPGPFPEDIPFQTQQEIVQRIKSFRTQILVCPCMRQPTSFWLEIHRVFEGLGFGGRCKCKIVDPPGQFPGAFLSDRVVYPACDHHRLKEGFLIVSRATWEVINDETSVSVLHATHQVSM